MRVNHIEKLTHAEVNEILRRGVTTQRRANEDVNHTRQEAYSALHEQERGFRKEAQNKIQKVPERTEEAVAAHTAGFQCQVHERCVQSQQALTNKRRRLWGQAESAMQEKQNQFENHEICSHTECNSNQHKGCRKRVF